jgi:hypothetical protein
MWANFGLTMKNLLLLVSVLGACAQDQSTPLHKLGDTTLELVSYGSVNAELKILGAGCPLLGDDVTATFDGLPMNISRGGYAETADGCYPIAFSISPDQAGGAMAYEAGTSSSDLIIEDASARWTISSTRLFANQFTIDAANSQITWQDVTAITTAQTTPVVPIRINGNVISYAAGTDIISVSAYAHPTPMRCEGPGGCLVDLSAAHDFKSQN